MSGPDASLLQAVGTASGSAFTQNELDFRRPTRPASLAGLCPGETGPTEDLDRVRTRSSGEFREEDGLECLIRGMVVIADRERPKHPLICATPGHPRLVQSREHTGNRAASIILKRGGEPCEVTAMKPSQVRFVNGSGSDSNRYEPWFIRSRAHLVACSVALEGLFSGAEPPRDRGDGAFRGCLEHDYQKAGPRNSRSGLHKSSRIILAWRMESLGRARRHVVDPAGPGRRPVENLAVVEEESQLS